MRATAFLAATAIVVAIGCTTSEKTSADTQAVSAKNQATLDSVSAAERAKAAAPTPIDTTAPAATTPTPPTPPTRTRPAGGSNAVSPAPSIMSPGRTKVGAAAPKETPRVATTGTVPPAPPVAQPPKVETRAAPTPAPAPAAAVANVEEGKEAYDANCRRCHGVRGVPPKAMQAKFPKIATFDAAFFANHSQDSVVKVLINGKGEDMKSFKDKLSQQQMRAIAAYIRTFGG